MQLAQQKSLVLILARELASNLATPFFVVDPDGTLVFYNEPAERILGQSFQESGALSADQWGRMFSPEDLDGSPLSPQDLALSIALAERRPSHQALVITGLDGARRRLAVTAFPLLATTAQLAGAVAIFWEDQRPGPG
jgi:PAS domain-containing protein